MSTRFLRSGSPPPDLTYLIHNGHLMASERDEQGFKQMLCVECQEHPLDLIWAHSPWTDEEIFKTGKLTVCECGEIHNKIMPKMYWGEDVTAICPCCSFPWCKHKQHKLADAEGGN